MIIKVQAYPGYIAVETAAEAISDLHTVMVSPIGIAEVTSGFGHRALGVARGTVVSGALARFVTHGIVSGVICAAAVQAGDRLMAEGNTSGPGLASGPGLVTPFNTITPTGTFSGYIASGFLSGLGLISGLVGVPLSGYAATTAFNTGRVIGRALVSGGIGSGIRMLVCVE